MLQFLEDRIVNNWPSYFGRRPLPQRLQPLILCSSPYRSIIMYFDRGCSSPFLKLKIGSPFEYIHKEYETLNRLRDVLPPPIRATLPRPLDIFACDGRLAVFEECLDGTTLFVKYNRCSHKALTLFDCADRALDWLVDFASDTRVSTLNSPAFLSEIAGAPVWKTDCPPGTAGFVGACCRRLAGSDLHLALTAVHGDFWLGNLLFRDHTLTGVVDWEYAHAAGESTSDLFHFLLTFANYVDRTERDRSQPRYCPSWGHLPGDWLEAVPQARSSTLVKAMRYVFFDDNCFARYARERTMRHLQKTATDPALATDLFSLYLARQASLFHSIADGRWGGHGRLYYKEFLDLLALWQIHSHESWIAALACGQEWVPGGNK